MTERRIGLSAALSSIVRPALAAGFLVSTAVAGSAQTVPCPRVLSAIRSAEVESSPRAPSAQGIAKQLGTSPTWVQRCATAYGRRLDGYETDDERREILELRRETREAEEIGREEHNDEVVDVYPNRDKTRQRAFSAFEEEWEPDEGDQWRPNTGRQWQPYLTDPFRTDPDDVPGLQRD